MSDLNKALVDIQNIRNYLAAGTVFQGFGPAVIATSGLLAIITATAQSLWPHGLADTHMRLLSVWIGVAVICAILIGLEMIARSRRHHGGMADVMLFNAVEVFLPAGFAGAFVALVIMTFAPDAQWILPGLWQLFVALGIFAALRSLPKSIVYCGAWYFITGISVLIIAASNKAIDPWMMGVPFGAGQFLMALLLHTASGDHDAQ